MKNGHQSTSKADMPQQVASPVAPIRNAFRRAITRQTLGGPKSSVVQGQTVISFAQGEDLFGLSLTGFDTAESNGCWSMTDRAKIVVPLGPQLAFETRAITIWIELTPYCPGPHRQSVEFTLLNDFRCDFQLTDFAKQTIAIVLPSDLVPAHHASLTILLPNASMPKALEGTDDNRHLGIKLHRLIVTYGDEELPVSLDVAPLVSIAAPALSSTQSRSTGNTGTLAPVPIVGPWHKALLLWSNFLEKLRTIFAPSVKARIAHLSEASAKSTNFLADELEKLQGEVGLVRTELTVLANSLERLTTQISTVNATQLTALVESSRLLLQETSDLRGSINEVLNVTANTKLEHSNSTGALREDLQFFQSNAARLIGDLTDQANANYRHLKSIDDQSVRQAATIQMAMATLSSQVETLNKIPTFSNEILSQAREDWIEASKIFVESIQRQLSSQSNHLNEIAFDTKTALQQVQVVADSILVGQSLQETIASRLKEQAPELANLQKTSHEVQQLVAALQTDVKSVYEIEQNAQLLLATLKGSVNTVAFQQARRLFQLDCETFVFFCDNGPLLIAASDKKFLVQLADQWGAFEPGTTATVRRLLKSGGSFVDIGAHVGWYTLLAARLVGATGQVWAFEPSPENASLIDKTLFINDVLHLVNLRQVAIGDTSSRAPLHILPVSAESSLLPIEGARRSIMVDIVKLDGTLPQDREIDLIKIDAEGSELRILAGMTEILRRNPRCKIIAEFGPSHLKRAAVSAAAWFEAFAQTGRSPTGIDEATGALFPITSAEAEQRHSINILWEP